MVDHRTPTERELEILKILWARGEATVREVYEEMSRSAPIVQNTVQAILRTMEEKLARPSSRRWPSSVSSIARWSNATRRIATWPPIYWTESSTAPSTRWCSRSSPPNNRPTGNRSLGRVVADGQTKRQPEFAERGTIVTETLHFLETHGGMLITGASALLAVGGVALLLHRAPINRQRAGELTIVAVMAWMLIACIPLPRFSTSELLPQTPPPAVGDVTGGLFIHRLSIPRSR